jgi:hypothetical protein
MIYRNYWTMMTSEDYDIMYRKGTSHRDIYKACDTLDAGTMNLLTRLAQGAYSSVAARCVTEE